MTIISQETPFRIYSDHGLSQDFKSAHLFSFIQFLNFSKLFNNFNSNLKKLNLPNKIFKLTNILPEIAIFFYIVTKNIN